MNKTTRLKKPQVPKLEDLYSFDDLGDRPKYGGEQMTSATDIPSFDEIRDETHSAVVAESTARYEADQALQAQIDQANDSIESETADRVAAIESVRTSITTVDSESKVRDNALQSQIDAISVSSDVADIVGTKAALDEYDTSSLTDNAIIKVLADESQSGATTYYRWDKASDTFDLVGSEGPYYTKSEADLTFVPKTTTVNGKPLSGNISLNYDDVDAVSTSEFNSTTSSLEESIGTKLNSSNVVVAKMLTVEATAWVEDATYDGYGYKANIPLDGVTAEYMPVVTFSISDAENPIFAPISETYDGGVSIYSKEVPGDSIVIQSVLCVKEN